MKFQSGFLFRSVPVLFLLGCVCLPFLIFLPLSQAENQAFVQSVKRLNALSESMTNAAVLRSFPLGPGYAVRLENSPEMTSVSAGDASLFELLEKQYPGNRALHGAFPATLREFRRTGLLVSSFRIQRPSGSTMVQAVLSYPVFIQGLEAAKRSAFFFCGLLLVFWVSAFLVYHMALRRFFKESGEALMRLGDGRFDIPRASHYSGGFEALAERIDRSGAEIKRRFQSLSSENERLQGMVKAFPLAAVILDKRDRVVLANPRFELLSHTKLNEGRFYWELLRDRNLDDMISRMKTLRSEFYSELRMRERVYRVSLIPSSGEQLLVVFDDVTERSNLEKIKRDFVANVSHELKTPLTAVRGFLETFADLRLEADQRRQLEIVERNTQRMVRIVNDLLTLSAIEEKAMNPARRSLDLKELISDVFSLLESAAQKKGLELRQEWEGQNWTLSGDREQLEALFLNLTDNAIKYTDHGSVTLNGKSDGETAVIVVKDTGIGIPREHLQRLFERFYVVDKSRSRSSGGTGLGLSIAKHAALFHNGEIRVDSRPGYGTEFTVILPLQKNHEEKTNDELN